MWNFSPGFTFRLAYSVVRACSLNVTSSFNRPLSRIRVAVITLVVEAMGRCSWILRPHSIAPVAASTRIADAPLHTGGSKGGPGGVGWAGGGGSLRAARWLAGDWALALP